MAYSPRFAGATADTEPGDDGENPVILFRSGEPPHPFTGAWPGRAHPPVPASARPNPYPEFLSPAEMPLIDRWIDWRTRSSASPAR